MARKISGGKLYKRKKKKLSERPGQPRKVKFGKEKNKKIKTMGGKLKVILLSAEKVNLMNTRTKKSKIVKIKGIIENPSYRLQKNVLVKGVIIDTTGGKAKITNRPGQEGCIQAVLIE